MMEIESLTHTMYWLEATLNQHKKICDWDEQSEDIKAEWRKSANSVIRVLER